MNTRDDIVDSESMAITVRVTGISQEPDHLAYRLHLEDIAGQPLRLDVFENNEPADWDWEAAQWYRFEDARGSEYDGYKNLNPGWDFDREPTAPPAETTHNSEETASSAEATSDTAPDQNGTQSPQTTSQSGRVETAPVEVETTRDDRSAHLIQTVADQRLTGVDVELFELSPEGLGKDTDRDQLWGTATARLAKYTKTPVAQRDGRYVVAMGDLPDTFDVSDGDTEIPLEITSLGETTLSPETAHHRHILESLLKWDLRHALPDRFTYQGINRIVATEPEVVSDEGLFGAVPAWAINIEVGPSGRVILGIVAKYDFQSLVSIRELAERGYELEGWRAVHDTEVYGTPATGYLRGWSDRRYATDEIPQLGESLAENHARKSNVDQAVVDTLCEENPQTMQIQYSSDGDPWHQAARFLKLTPDMETLFDIDEGFAYEAQSQSKLSPPERVEKAQTFADALGELEAFGLTVSWTQTNDHYESLDIRGDGNNLVFGGGNVEWNPSYGLRKHGVFKQPDETLTIGLLAPDPLSNLAEELFDGLRSWINEVGVDAAYRTELYPAGEEYATVGLEIVDGLDSAFVLVPNKGQLPPGINDPFDPIKRQFHREGVGTQMIEKDTAEQLTAGSPPSLRNNTTANLTAGVLAKAQVMPWGIAELPDPPDAFIGLDTGYRPGRDQHTGAGASVVLADGTTFTATSASQQSGEKIQPEDIANFVETLYRNLQRETGLPPEHVVLHRDGFANESVTAVSEKLDTFGLTYDLVEVRKSGATRMAEWNDDASRFENPHKGQAFVSEYEDYAILTGSGQPTMDEISNVGTPRPLQIEKKHGPTDFESLLRQCYWLSELHVGSPARPARLPVTTLYADKMAEAVANDHVSPESFVRGAVFV